MRGALRAAQLLTVAAVCVGAALPSAAQSKARKIERELVGVRIWRSFNDVLKKLGSPTSIEVGASYTPSAQTTTGAAGGGYGGYGSTSGFGATSGGFGSGQLPGLPGLGAGGAMGRSGGAYGGGMMGRPAGGAMMGGGMMGRAGLSGSRRGKDDEDEGGGGSRMMGAGRQSMGGMGGGMMGRAAGGATMGGGGMMGAGAMGNRGGIRAPQQYDEDGQPISGGRGGVGGFGARPGGMGSGLGGSSMGMSNGLAGFGGGATGIGGPYGSSYPGQEIEEPEITWAYERKLTKVVDGITKTDTNVILVLFNKDGRVIQVQSFGYSGGAGVTSRGIRLGDTMTKVYNHYGWTANVQQAFSGSMGSRTLDYSRTANVAFQFLDLGPGKGYRVVGITVAATDKTGM